MFSSVIKAAAVASFLFGAPALADNLGKPTLFKDGLSPHVNDEFMQYMPSTPSTNGAWSWGWIPQRCADEANRADLQYMPSTPSTNGAWSWGWIPQRCADEANRADPPLSLYDFEVFNVQYEDCEEAWIFCRHTQAQLTQSQLIDYFGRLPVHERQSVSYVIGVPGGGSAYEIGGLVVFQGATASVSVFQHEVGHAVDAYNNADGTSSSTKEFLDAIDGDTCVPDDYANSSNVEDYTQVGVLLMYNTVVPGGLDKIGADYSCLSKQLAVVAARQQAAMELGGTCTWRQTYTIGTDYSCLSKQLAVVAARQQAAMELGGTCTWRQTYGEVISMGPASGNNKRAIGPKPIMNLVPGHPLAIEKDINRGGAVTHYGEVESNKTADALAAQKQKEWNAVAKHRAVRRSI
ncbi:hypothetical protein V495_04067 [Pseudogymnoascus sp. VKM F-4514 (FW-929)]|nr:hypothetical protein V495_04067 [Pseudogymnoascus sp. VKM F-4514 (FW-929)]